ncbi:MAG: hypothetical protein WAN39_09935 [Candidatus Cybelea sp.]
MHLLRSLCSALFFAALIVEAACTSNCDDAGLTVDDKGDIVVRGENGFISPNSSILQNVRGWPQAPFEEENFAFSQGYTLARDGAMYLLENTVQHPNLVYRINLASGAASPVGGSSGDNPSDSAGLSTSTETEIAASGRYVYSVDQRDATISREPLLSQHPALTVFISGAKTQLNSPIAVAVDQTGRVCALDSASNRLLCYAADRSGNVAPDRAIGLKQLLGYEVVLDMVFDQAGRIILSGARNPNGFSDTAIAVVDLRHRSPRVVRVIAGAHTKLLSPQLAVDAAGNILALQREAPTMRSNREILAFAPWQRGDVAPQWVRKPAATVSHPFRLAVDASTGDVAILGSDGTALFRGAARRAPPQWPAETRLAARGWSVALGAGALIVANEFGGIEKYGLSRAARDATSEDTRLSLHDPAFIATDQSGTIFAASTDGVITRFPHDTTSASGWKRTVFATTFGRNMDAFAADNAGHFYLSAASKNAIVTVGADGTQGVLTGIKTGLNYPLGLAVNREGALYVANTGSNEVLIFARGSTGDAGPVARLSGPATQLVAPQALAIDASGKLYVFDGPQTAQGFGATHHVRVYDAGAHGNVPPIQTYDVQTKCWTNAV